ncbi:MAG: relaxase/mobilization nuclease domain-containing protein [Ferruginibacter sp.]
MISKVIIGKVFYGACRYICKDKNRATVLETSGVRTHDYKLMAKDFELQQQLRPGLHKAVFHGILSFYPGEKVTDQMMVEIAQKYLKELQIENTQYAITKHIDKDHQHLHILANLVNNKGVAIKDGWIGLNGKKVSQKLTKEYGLIPAEDKHLDKSNLQNLNAKEANRYVIYQAILNTLPKCKNLEDLKQHLAKQKIDTLYKYKRQTNELQGISFMIGNLKFKGSEIDRNFSVKNLQRIFENQQQLGATARPQSLLIKRSKIPANDLQRNMSISKENLLNNLLNPEQINEPVNHSLLPKKKKKAKRKYRGL